MYKRFSIDFENIIRQEYFNDGMSVFLYYDTILGTYMAFGLSSFYVDHVISPFFCFSDEFQMPVAILSKEDVKELRQSMEIIEHEPHSFYRLQTKNYIGKEGYEKWVQSVIKD